MVDQIFSKHYSISGLTEKVHSISKSASSKLVKTVVTLYVILENPNVPIVVKATIVGALGYFICPIDLIPDFLPGGFVDDLAVLTATLGEVYIYYSQEVKDRVEELLPQWSKEH
jgi:uncharacterized membrane protein YkvA (DUF1232 family)